MMTRRILTQLIAMAGMLCLWAGGTAAARADDVQVTAAVSDASTDVGQEVDYTITVNGATDTSPPEKIDVDGLTINYTGPNVQKQVSFGTGFGSGGHIQRSVVHTFSVVPTKPGQFVIPAQTVVVDGKNYTTNAVNLTVGGTAAAGGDANGQFFYSEVVLGRDSAYIGEAIPVEVRLYVDARVPARLESGGPDITAEGCTVQKMSKPVETTVVRDGRQFDLVTFKTAITAARAGKITIGPVSTPIVAQVPQGRRRRPRGGPFDDPFFQNFDDAFGMMTQQQQVNITAPAVDLSVKALPARGQPRSFAGAVGNFTMTASVNPVTVQAGDPVTITAKITGRGDFDRVTAPELTDADGWKTYPTTGKYVSDDDVGISGSKTFEIGAIPKKSEVPEMEWSYFDPINEVYVTLTEKGEMVTVQGAAQAQSAPVVAQQPAAPAATPAGPDILYIRAESAGWGRTFEPIYTSKAFWAAQGVPLAALVAFVGMQIARRRAADEEARKRDQWRKEKEAELSKMQSRDVPESALYEAAARAMRLEVAMQTGRAPDTLDGNEVAKARVLDAEMAERVRALFDRQAEVLYAGSSSGSGAASAKARVELLETVKGYENAKRAE
jgi:hypothetical protein